MSVATKLWTIEDLEAMEDNGARFELLRDELIEMPVPKLEHGVLVGRLMRAFSDFVEEFDLGFVVNNCAFGLRREPDSLLIPDVAYISTERMPPGNTNWELYLGPPDAAVEVVSPSDSAPDVHDKILELLESGVRVVIAVWPQSRTISVHRPGGATREFRIGDVLEIDDVLPGFRFSVADLFRRPGPG